MVTRPAVLWVALALLIPEAWSLLGSSGLQPLRAPHLGRGSNGLRHPATSRLSQPLLGGYSLPWPPRAGGDDGVKRNRWRFAAGGRSQAVALRSATRSAAQALVNRMSLLREAGRRAACAARVVKAATMARCSRIMHVALPALMLAGHLALAPASHASSCAVTSPDASSSSSVVRMAHSSSSSSSSGGGVGASTTRTCEPQPRQGTGPVAAAALAQSPSSSFSFDVSAKAQELVAEAKFVCSELAEDATEAFAELAHEVRGAKRDVLILLLATAAVIPAFTALKLSPILGFLLSGCVLGPNGLSLVSDVHTIEVLAEFGVVFFLFEMGLELSLERLISMKKDVFGLGSAQLAVTTLGLGCLAPLVVPGCNAASAFVIGIALALSSSAFVLQILKDKEDMSTRHGRAAFGILLLQDLAIVPMLVAIPLLAGDGSLITAIRQSVVKSSIALGAIGLIGRYALNPVFKIVASSKSQEAFLGLILLTVTGMSAMTEGLGLSNTLGAFLAGVLLSETKYRYQVEADIVPFRGLLLGLFFITVGFTIDTALLIAEPLRVASLVGGLLALKALVITVLCRFGFGITFSQGLQAGLLLAQGGEFAFVAFRLAEGLTILSEYQTKLLMTATAITMALTPALAETGYYISRKLERSSGFSHYVGDDPEAEEIKAEQGLVVVCGYGRIGKVVCEVLDRKFVRYIAFDNDPAKAIEARNRGLPVFYGDVSRPEVLQNFHVGDARMVVTCVSNRHVANQCIVTLRRLYPELPILARATDGDHQKRLTNTLEVMAMVPVLPEDSLLLNLPFGGAVLKALGYQGDEVASILDDIMDTKQKKSREAKVYSPFRRTSGAETDEDEESTGVVMQGETAALEAETIRAVERLKEEAAAKEKAAKADPKKSGSSGKEEKAEEKAPAPKEKETVDPEKEDPAGPSSF